MSNFDRRQFLKGILGKLAQAAGAVVVASAAVSTATAEEQKSEGAETPPLDVQERADRLVATGKFSAEEAAVEANEFLNVGIGRPGGWVNRGWQNGGWGGGFHNGGWPNMGGFRNAPWVNGGWPNVGWRNWWG